MTKVISLSDRAYESLKLLKEGKKESFSDVVLKLIEEKSRSLLSFAGRWKEDEEVDGIFERIAKERHATKQRVVGKW